jgi:5-methylcytosine-specific restriction endonuclease McrA
VSTAEERGVISFAEKMLELLDEGRYASTYKFAVLLGLIDLCLERTLSSGLAPDMLTTRQLAEKIIELYWPHSMPFVGQTPVVLKQNVGGQAEILSDIVHFRAHGAADPSVPRWEARRVAGDLYERLVRRVEWKLIEMPLPRLQLMGQSQQRFVYEIHWDERVRRSDVALYQAGRPSTFDNRIQLMSRVGGYMLQLNGLLRPLIQRRWAAMVAHLNRLEDSRLESFLFGASRAQTTAIRAGLWTIQGRRCFYCHAEVADLGRTQVDHFIPWSRYPDDGLDNLVVADMKCNGLKGNSLAAAEHVARWVRRFESDAREYASVLELAERTNWTRDAVRNLNVARGIYLRLPDDARLWLRDKQFIEPDQELIRTALK